MCSCLLLFGSWCWLVWVVVVLWFFVMVVVLFLGIVLCVFVLNWGEGVLLVEVFLIMVF